MFKDMRSKGPRLKNFLQSQKIEPVVRKRGTKYDALSTSPEKLTGNRKKLKKNDGPGNSMGSRSDHQEKKKLSILKQGTPSPDPLPNVWNTLTMEDKRKVHFSKMVPEAEQKTGNKAKHDGLYPSPELKSVERQKKKKHTNPSYSKSPSPEKMGVRKRQGGVTPDYERKDTLSPVKIKIIEKVSSEKRVKRAPTMITLEQLLQGIVADRRFGSETSLCRRDDLSDKAGSDSRLFSTSPDVCQIMEDIDAGKHSRLRKEIKEELTSIKDRVKEALYVVDMYDEDEDLDVVTKFPPINSLEIMKKRREKMKKEKAVLQRVYSYQGTCEERYALLAEVEHWMSSTDLVSDLPAEADLNQMSRHFLEIHSHVMTALHRYGSLSEKVMDFGNCLLATTHAIMVERKQQAKEIEEKEQDKTVVIDERLLLADQNKWEKAIKMIMNTFDDAAKWTKNAGHKNVIKKGISQFKELSSGMKKRNTELKEKRKAVDEAKSKLQTAKADVEGKTKELEDLRKNVRNLTTEVEEKKHMLSKSEENSATIMQKCHKLDAQIKELQKEVAKGPKVVEKVRPATPPPPPSPPPPEIIKVIDSATQLKLSEAEKEIEEQKTKLQKAKDEIRTVERLLRKEKERVRQLRLELEEAISRAEEAELTVAVEQPQQDPAPEVQIVETGDKDSTYYKTLLAGTKKDFNAELEKIKSHLTKERLRNAAMVKRVEDNHKEQLNVIQKNVVRVLRAIMHFRDHVCTIVEKESLKDASRSLQGLGSLIPDKLVPDPKELLALLVGSVVEFMHNMEVVMANAFLTMRMMIKGSITMTTTKEFIAGKQTENRIRMEEVKRNMRQIDVSKEESKKLALRLKMAKEKLIKFEELTERQEVHDRKYLALLDRYRRVWKMYNNLNKDMTILQGDLQNAIDEKVKENEGLLISQMKMELKNRPNVHDKELEMSIMDQKKNIRMLEQAYEKNKISKDMYFLIRSLLEKSLEIPKIRLRYMMEQYVAFRSIKETRARVLEILRGEDLSKHIRRDMEKYVKQIDEKLTKSMNIWHSKINLLNQEKKNLFKMLWKMFGEVFVESGLLLVHPLLNTIAHDKSEVYGKLAATAKRESLRSICARGHKRVHEFLHLPTFVEGCSVLSTMTDEQSLWNAQFSCGDDAIGAPIPVSPHLLNYDVNRERLNARRSLESQSSFGNHGRPILHLPVSRNYYITPKLECLSAK